MTPSLLSGAFVLLKSMLASKRHKEDEVGHGPGPHTDRVRHGLSIQ
jgi:hypothetical protein